MHLPKALLSSWAALLGLALVVLLPRIAAAAWPTDSTVNVPVCTAPHDQTSPQILMDGAGGAIVSWKDLRSGTGNQVYAQHVLASGEVDPAWPIDGRAVPGSQMVADGAGGAIVVGQVLGSSGWHIFAHHLLSSGVLDPAWPVNGRAVSTATNDTQGGAQLVADGAGGAVIVWRDSWQDPNRRTGIYAQHVLASGEVDPAWPDTASAVCAPSWDQSYGPTVVTDGAGGAIVTWGGCYSYPVTCSFIAKHVLATGILDPAWPANGCAVPGSLMIVDGAGGAIVLWGTYTQHLLARGVVDPTWPVNGCPVCPKGGDPRAATMVADGAGGALVAWMNYANGAGYDMFVQHVLASGVTDPAWPAWGRELYTAANWPAIVTDAAGGAIVAWVDGLNGTSNYDLHAMRWLRSGVRDPDWPADGGVLCAAPSNQTSPQIVTDAAGGAIVTWQDYRSGTNWDIYAQRVLPNGQLGGDIPTPTRVSLVSAGVEGGMVRLRWYVSPDGPALLTVYRSTVAGVWQALGTLTPDGSGYLRYEDAAVVAGARYGYRLGLRLATGVEQYTGEAWVEVPLPGADLAVWAPSPVVGGEVTVSFSGPPGRSVDVSLLDLAGRVVASRRVAGGSGRHSVDLARSNDLAPGVYLVRVELDRPAVARVAVIR